MTSEKLFVTSLMLILSLTAVYGDLGINFIIPDLVKSVQTSIGQGVTPLVQANGTIQPNIVQNDNGAISALIETVNKIVNPLSTLLGSVVAATRDGGTNSSVLFNNLTDQANLTLQSLNESLTIAGGMENKTNPTLFEQSVGNITQLISHVASVNSSFGALFTAVYQVQSSSVLITSSNVSSIITTAIVNSFINPLANISACLSHISILTAAIVMEKSSVLSYTNLYTSSFGTQQTTYQSIYISSILRAITDTNNSLAVLSTGFDANVKQAYSSIMNQLEQDSFSNMTDFLGTVGNLTNDLIQKTNQGLTALKRNINQTLTNHSQTVVDNLYKAVYNLTSTGFSSAGLYGNRCVLFYGPQFSLIPVFVGRLSQCSIVENESLGTLLQTVRMLLEQVKSTAITSANGVPVCHQNPGRCSEVFFSAFPDLTQQISAQLNTTADVINQEILVIQNRVHLCGTATTADINEYNQSVLNAFVSCLQKGI